MQQNIIVQLAIHVINKSAIDLKLWIMVSGSRVLNPFPDNKHQVINFPMLYIQCDLKFK